MSTIMVVLGWWLLVSLLVGVLFGTVVDATLDDEDDTCS